MFPVQDMFRKALIRPATSSSAETCRIVIRRGPAWILVADPRGEAGL